MCLAFLALLACLRCRRCLTVPTLLHSHRSDGIVSRCILCCRVITALVRGVPVAILRPMIGATEAVNALSTGVRASLG